MIHPDVFVEHRQFFPSIPLRVAYALFQTYGVKTNGMREHFMLDIMIKDVGLIIKLHKSIYGLLPTHQDKWLTGLTNHAPSVTGLLMYLHWDILRMQGLISSNNGDKEKEIVHNYWNKMQLPHWNLLCQSVEAYFKFEDIEAIIKPHKDFIIQPTTCFIKDFHGPSILSAPWLSSSVVNVPKEECIIMV